MGMPGVLARQRRPPPPFRRTQLQIPRRPARRLGFSWRQAVRRAAAAAVAVLLWSVQLRQAFDLPVVQQVSRRSAGQQVEDGFGDEALDLARRAARAGARSAAPSGQERWCCGTLSPCGDDGGGGDACTGYAGEARSQVDAGWGQVGYARFTEPCSVGGSSCSDL